MLRCPQDLFIFCFQQLKADGPLALGQGSPGLGAIFLLSLGPWFAPGIWGRARCSARLPDVPAGSFLFKCSILPSCFSCLANICKEVGALSIGRAARRGGEGGGGLRRDTACVQLSCVRTRWLAKATEGAGPSKSGTAPLGFHHIVLFVRRRQEM